MHATKKTCPHAAAQSALSRYSKPELSSRRARYMASDGVCMQSDLRRRTLNEENMCMYMVGVMYNIIVGLRRQKCMQANPMLDCSYDHMSSLV